jgi:hypothetical protein
MPMPKDIERRMERHRQRRNDQLEARDQGRKALLGYKPPSGYEGGVPGGWG